MFSRKVRWLSHSLICLTMAMAGRADVQYDLVDLDTLDGDISLFRGLNESGQVSGILLKNNALYICSWRPEDGLNKRRCHSLPQSPLITNDGQIVGSCWQRQSRGGSLGDQAALFLWDNIFSRWSFTDFRIMPAPPEQLSTTGARKMLVVYDCNDSGQILLTNHDSLLWNPAKIKLKYPHDPKRLMWLYEHGAFTAVHHPMVDAVMRINNHGQILCWHMEFDLAEQRHCPRTGVLDWKTQSFRLLQYPSWNDGNDINDRNEIVGIFFDPISQTPHGFFEDEQGCRLVLEDFNPTTLNCRGVVIGSFMDEDRQDQPAIWKNGEFSMLSDVVGLTDAHGHEWDSLDDLVAINDAGQILGRGTYQGKSHAFLLNPLPPLSLENSETVSLSGASPCAPQDPRGVEAQAHALPIGQAQLVSQETL